MLPDYSVQVVKLGYLTWRALQSHELKRPRGGREAKRKGRRARSVGLKARNEAKKDKESPLASSVLKLLMGHKIENILSV